MKHSKLREIIREELKKLNESEETDISLPSAYKFDSILKGSNSHDYEFIYKDYTIRCDHRYGKWISVAITMKNYGGYVLDTPKKFNDVKSATRFILSLKSKMDKGETGKTISFRK
jgi:hypothetical protein